MSPKLRYPAVAVLTKRRVFHNAVTVESKRDACVRNYIATRAKEFDTATTMEKMIGPRLNHTTSHHITSHHATITLHHHITLHDSKVCLIIACQSNATADKGLTLRPLKCTLFTAASASCCSNADASSSMNCVPGVIQLLSNDRVKSGSEDLPQGITRRLC